MSRNKPIESISANRRLLYTDYGDKVIISPAPRGSYGLSQTAKLPVRPVPTPPPLQQPPAPKPLTARQVLRQSLGLDSIGTPPAKRP